MNTSVDINKIFELIDLYKYASISGERVEIIITPYEENGKWNNSKRVITIGLQDGISRDRDSFIVDNAEDFDKFILPQILSYFSEDDKLGKWDIVVPSVQDTTVKGIVETESGNLVYLESLDENIFLNVTKEKESVEEKTTYKKISLINEDKIWEEVILYAKRRRMIQDFYKGSTYSIEEQNEIYNFILNVIEQEKSISYGSSRKNLYRNEEIFEEIFKDKDKLLKLGLNEELITKLINTSAVKKIAYLAGVEKRARRYLELQNTEIISKIEFATTELDKVDYFDLRNASVQQFENGIFISNQPKAIINLEKIYENEGLYSEEIREKYTGYCKEILGYLEKKAKTNNKVINSDVVIPNVEFVSMDDSIVDSYEKFVEAIDLLRYGKLDDENYEIIVEPDNLEPSKRKVRLSLTGGVSRADTFNFIFTDGNRFDIEFQNILEEIRKEDPNFISEITFNGLDKTSLHESQEGNEILIKHAPDNLAYPRSTKIVEEQKDDLFAQLLILEKEINDEARKNDEKVRLKDENIETETPALEQNRSIFDDYRIVLEIQNGGAVDNAFEEIKYLQELSLIDYNASINLNGIRVPASDIETLEDFDIIYNALLTKDKNTIKDYAINHGHTISNIPRFLVECSESMKNEENNVEDEFTLEEIEQIIREVEEKRNNIDYSEQLEEKIDTTVDFEKLHEYVIKYKIGNSTGALQIFNRDTGSEYIPPTEEEKRNIEFATYWAVMAGIQESPDDVVVGEKYAFNEQSKKLYDIFNVQFKESTKRNIPIDYESLKQQFLSSGVENADKIYERLFKNQFYMDYVTLYYKKSLAPEALLDGIDISEIRDERQEILEEFKKYSKEQSSDIQQKQEREGLLQQAYKLAKLLLEKLQRQEIKESAEIEAHNLQRHNEEIELKESAEIEAHNLQRHNEEIELKEGAEAQASLLLESEKDNLFEIVEQQHEIEKSPEIREIINAYEVVEFYATAEQPTSIKVFFGKDNLNEAEVILSNGIAENETTMYQRTFEVEKLKSEIIPLLCSLYAKDNKITNNQSVDVPNTGKSALIVIGTNDKVFQVSNATKDIVELCQMTLANELEKNKTEEQEKKII